MKIEFEEEKINMVLLMLNQLQVKGVEQAQLVVAMNNTLHEGKAVQEEKEAE